MWPSVTGSHMFAPSGGGAVPTVSNPDLCGQLSYRQLLNTPQCFPGDDVSGWHIRGVSLSPYSYPICNPFFTYGGTIPHDRSNASDPAPLVPAFVGDGATQLAGTCAAVIADSPDPAASPLWRHDLTSVSNPGVVQVSSADGASCLRD